MKAVVIAIRMALLAGMLAPAAAWAYPPEPDSVIYGLVKDQYGVALSNPAATVVLQTPGGVQIAANIQPDLAVGVNYYLRVPMDSGSIPPPYVHNALTAGTLYKLYVVVGSVTNLPIEMSAGFQTLVPSAQMALQNLTLGSDGNSDGIPDAWESAFLASLGLNAPLGNINPNSSYTQDGRSLRQEYLMGNFPYQSNAFSVNLVSLNAGSAALSFTTAPASHSYTAAGSADLVNWTPLDFTIPALGTNVMSSYSSSVQQPLQIQTIQPANVPQMQFFRLQLH